MKDTIRTDMEDKRTFSGPKIHKSFTVAGQDTVSQNKNHYDEPRFETATIKEFFL